MISIHKNSSRRIKHHEREFDPLARADQHCMACSMSWDTVASCHMNIASFDRLHPQCATACTQHWHSWTIGIGNTGEGKTNEHVGSDMAQEAMCNNTETIWFGFEP